MKQIGLWERSQECAQDGLSVAFALESPADPMTYDPEALVKDMPSFWDLREVREAQQRNGFFQVQFDQGALGHSRRKPTTLLSNMVTLQGLQALTGRATESLEPDLGRRLEQTKSWAAWAPGLVRAVKDALRVHLGTQVLGSTALKGMSLEAWRDHVRRGHIPYSRDCRTCLREMGVDAHHRRQKGCGYAYTMSADVVGPFEPGFDAALKGRAKYAVVATVAVPIFSDAAQGDSEDVEPDADEKLPDLPDGGDLPIWDQCPEDVEWATDEEVVALNAKVLADRLPPEEGRLQNLTFVEVIASRQARDIAHALALIYSRLRAYGIPVLRLHTDRAKEFLSSSVRSWASERSIWQTMTGGDDPAGNGRVESEINQLKRRTRLLLSSTRASSDLWPCALRHAAAERLGGQMKALGLPQRAMLPFYSKVMVRVKRWHQEGALRSPYKQVHLLGPSPLMHHGWAVRDSDGRVQHARVAALPSPLADQAEAELWVDADADAPRRRLHGKQTVEPLVKVGEYLAGSGGVSASGRVPVFCGDGSSEVPDLSLRRSGGSPSCL